MESLTRSRQLRQEDAKDTVLPEDEEKSGKNVGGFVFHRRKAKNQGTAMQIDDADPEVALAAISRNAGDAPAISRWCDLQRCLCR